MFRLIWNLCLLRARPSQIPYSVTLLLGFLAVHFSVVFMIISVAASSLWVGAWKTLLLEASIAGCTALALYFRGLSRRFVQTLTALIGTNTLILTLTAIPYIIILLIVASTSSNWAYYLGMTLCMALLLIGSIWLFIIYARIYRHALHVSINEGLLVALILFGITAGIFSVSSIFN